MRYDDARIEKSEVIATLLILGAKPSKYRLYLAAQRLGAPGRERALDLLTSDRRFLPLRAARGDAVHLVNRDHIVWAAVDAGDASADWIEREAGQRVPVTMELSVGGALKGELQYLLPETTRRVSDYLDRSEPFIPLWTKDRCVLVNRAFVSRVSTRTVARARPKKRKVR